MGMRLAIPGAGLGIGASVAAATCGGFFCDVGTGALIGLAVGLISGAVIAPIVDSVGMGLEDVPPKKPSM